MNTKYNTNQYLLLFRGTQWDKGMSPDEIQKVMVQWTAWFDGLAENGKLKSGQPLLNEGKFVSGKKGRNVADGPFVESKETIGGYFLVEVDTMEEAIAIAQQCPALDYGLTVEVRPVAECCQIGMKAAEQLLAASA